ncbi:MAG: hypothetical protein GY795_47175 [Desulfobacterales bacterium]|nr:hypothetical protein [Desulfobacterales bacterium]
MQTWLKEKIGNPELFTGRKEELTYFLNWTDRIKREISQSTAVLSRRKTGKTAMLQRLYNLTFQKNDTVVPFYIEIRESDQWLLDFSREFLFTFIYQYIAFRTRKPEYFRYSKSNYSRLLKAVQKEKLDYLIHFIEDAELVDKQENADTLWNIARDLPRLAAEETDGRVIQIIDEFQFLNRFIYWDKEKTRKAHGLAGSYLGTAEYKNAPMLVAGSWVGWLARDIHTMLPGRFQFHYLENLPEQEAIEMILKYSHLENIPVTRETVPLMAGLTEGNPFYISSLFRSRYPKKNFTTEKGLLETLEFETLSKGGWIKGTWMEYVLYAMQETNGDNAKRIVLYLCKHREREVTRTELLEKLNLGMSDSELEDKLEILLGADIIEQGVSNLYYQGVPDNIFDKVFRGVYAAEIETFSPKDITKEYYALSQKLKKNNKRLRGEYSRYKGAFAEFVIIQHLRHDVLKNSKQFRSAVHNLPDDFDFTEYKTVWSYNSPPLHEPEFQIDIFARAEKSEYSLIWEVKNRKAKFSKKEAEVFVKKAEELMRIENIDKALLFVFSVNGFFKTTVDCMKKHGIAWTSDRQWLD